MKFRRKPGIVEVGLVTGDPHPADLGAIPMYPGMPMPVRVVILNETGKAFAIGPALLESEYEPADGDAETWLAGLRERMAPKVQQSPCGMPPDFRPDGGRGLAEDFDMEVQTDPDSPPHRIRFVEKKKKPLPPAPPPPPAATGAPPPGWPATLTWPPRGSDIRPQAEGEDGD